MCGDVLLEAALRIVKSHFVPLPLFEQRKSEQHVSIRQIWCSAPAIDDRNALPVGTRPNGRVQTRASEAEQRV